MTQYDCFNGDADGICALTQLRLSQPCESTLITGVKRDINLLQRVDVEKGDQVVVLDVSLDKNRSGLDTVLSAGASVFYCDHHFAGEIPEHDQLHAIINTSADVCTSLLINQHLKGEFLPWAVVGTFGDNLKKSAIGLAKPLGLNEIELVQLENLGIYLNYNGYGSALEDLYFDPADLFLRVSAHSTPGDFINQDTDCFKTLEQGYHDDMQAAAEVKPHFDRPHAAVYLLPDFAWARRVSGVFSNDLANQHSDRAHAVLSENAKGGYLVSVRAPLNNKQGADEICRQFETGGGRAAAAGINHLPETELGHFIDVINQFYQG